MAVQEIPIVLQPKQLELGKLLFQTGIDASTWLAFGGARAGGKSGGLRRLMLERRLRLPGTNGAIIRRVYDEVKRNHIDKYFEEFPLLRDWYRVGDKEIVLPNGSKIIFAYAENQQEVDRKFWGVEFYDIFVDQAEQFSERELTIIKSCNRWPGAPINDCKTALFFNPGGIGTEFLRRIFYQQKYFNKERAQDYKFIHVFGWDNHVWFEPLGLTPAEFYAMQDMCDDEHGIGPDFKCCRFHMFINRTSEGRKLDAMPPSLRAGHLLGSFEQFAGQYFAGVWDESKLILTAEQEDALIQPWWNRWVAHDDGLVHHAAMGWATSGKVSPDLFKRVFGVEISESVPVVVIYRDQVMQGIDAGAFVRIARKETTLEEAKTLSRYFLSVDAWEKNSKGHSTADEIAKECSVVEQIEDKGHPLHVTWPQPEQAANGRIGGWRFLYAMMKKTGDVLDGKMNPTRLEDDFDDNGGGYSVHTPLLFISGHCTDVIDAIPMAITDTKHSGRAEDVLKQPTKADDVCDMVRYLCKSMINPKTGVPLAVQAKEKWDDMGDADMTVKAIAMRKLEVQDKRGTQGRRSSWAR
jgi:hypothetical protein